MVPYTREMKERLEKALANMNAELAKAIETLEADNRKGTIEHGVRALELKEDAVSCFPGIEVIKGIDLPFFAVYDTFYDLDQARSAAQTAIVLKGLGDADAERIPEAIAKLKLSLAEVKLNMVQRPPWVAGDETKSILDDLVEKIERAIKKLEDNADGTATSDDGALHDIWLAKREFLIDVSDPMRLWDAYTLLEVLDIWLDGLVRYPIGPEGRWPDVPAGVLRDAKRAKEKLELLVRRTPLKEHPGEAAPGAPESVPPPPPDYPPGYEDLPPFPPPLPPGQEWA